MSELQHPEARSFELVASLYERARPEYPAEAVRWIAERLDMGAGRVVLDLAAGTGKLTRALVETGARVIAVEPGDAMRAQLERAVPNAESLRGSAEDIPLEDRSVDAVTVAQGFHWFRHDEALPEIHRVLRRGGGLGLIWNARDQESPLQREVNELLAAFIPAGRAAVHDSTKHLAASTLFGSIEERRFRFAQELNADELVARLSSVSFVAAATPERRAEFERQLRELSARHGDLVTYPYVTDVYVSAAV